MKAASDGLHPFEFLLSITRDEAQPLEIRISAARAALPYCAHRRHSIELMVDESRRAIREYSDEELMEIIANGQGEKCLPT